MVVCGFWQCQHGKSDDKNNGSLMEMDKNPADYKNVTMHHAKDSIRLEEAMPNLSENPNIMQMDLDVVKGVRSNQIRLVKPGEKMKLEERPIEK